VCGFGEADVWGLSVASCHYFLGIWGRHRSDSLVADLDFVFVFGHIDDGFLVCGCGVLAGREAICEFGAGVVRGGGGGEEREVRP